MRQLVLVIGDYKPFGKDPIKCLFYDVRVKTLRRETPFF